MCTILNENKVYKNRNKRFLINIKSADNSYVNSFPNLFPETSNITTNALEELCTSSICYKRAANRLSCTEPMI